MAKNPNGTAHENLTEYSVVQSSSNRSFGLVFSAFFALLGAYKYFFTEVSDGQSDSMLWVYIFLGVSGGFLAISFLFPQLLAPLNKLWFRFGMLLAMIIQPIVMALLFFLTIMPIGLFMRLLGKDLLSLKRKPEAKSYWITRTPPGPEPESLKNQF